MTARDTTHLPLGLSCLAAGAGAMWIASEYPFGSVRAMGPGFIPMAVALFLLVLGVGILALRGRDVDAAGQPAGHAGWRATARAMACILGAIVVFGLGIQRLGLAATLLLVVTIAGHAPTDGRLAPVLALAVALSAGACLVFVGLLGLQIPVLPRLG